MSSFKKQAIKLKQEFREKGFAVPLVSVQEALAKAYGFNNRHVAFSKEKEINSLFATLHQSQTAKKELEYPEFITSDNASTKYVFTTDSDDDQYLSRFSDLEIFDGANLPDGYKITMFKEALKNILLSDIVDVTSEELENIFEDWEWAPKISDFVGRLTLTSFLEQGEIFEDKAPDNLKVKVEDGFLIDEEKLKKAWKSVMKCFDFKKKIEGIEIPVYETTNISYRYEKARDRFVLINVTINPKKANIIKSINELNLSKGEDLLSSELAKRVGNLEKGSNK